MSEIDLATFLQLKMILAKAYWAVHVRYSSRANLHKFASTRMSSRRIFKSARELLASARASLAEPLLGVCTPIARVQNTRERLSMYVRNTNLIAREQCKHVPRYVRILSCTTSSSSF